MTPEEITKLAEEYVEEIYPHEEFEDIGQMDFLRNTAKKNVASFIRWLLRTHCIVGKEFVKRQRLVIEHDKKLMLEKPIGEKIALAGVYQAKLELMDKLFGSDTFNETDK